MEKDSKTLKSVENIELESAKKRLESLSDGNWSICQIFLQEIQANDLVTEVLDEKQGTVSLTQQIETLKERISFEFKDDSTLFSLIMSTLPSYHTIWRWTKTQKWQDAVYSRIEYAHLFNNKNKAKVVKGIFDKATAPGREDMRASELYFKIYHKVFAKNDEAKGKDQLGDLQAIVLGKKAK